MQRTKWFTSEAADSSVALFAAMHALEIAEAQLQHAVIEATEAREASKDDECPTPEHVVANLLHAARVAHAACETALTRVEPMYEENVHGTEEEHGLCYEMVNTALTNARTVASALEYASTQYAGWSMSLYAYPQLQQMLWEDAMRVLALNNDQTGVVALGVVLLSSDIPPPRGLFLRSLNARMLQILLFSPILTATINDCDDQQNTALMLASARGHADAVRVLLTCSAVAASAAIKTNSNSFTALMIASSHGNAETVTALLDCPAVGLSAGVVNKFGRTALMTASLEGHTETVAALLACPAVIASASTFDMYGETALMLASCRGPPPVITVLLECPAVVASANFVNANGNTALMIAASTFADAKVVGALLACPAVVASANVVNTHGNTALIMAANCGNAARITALLTCSVVVASAGVANNRGNTALSIASSFGNTRPLHALLACPVIAASASDSILVRAAWLGK
jgi:ankyrin repeat protein